MKRTSLSPDAAHCFVEITHDVVRASTPQGGFSHPIQRESNGRISVASRQEIVNRLRALAPDSPRSSSVPFHVWCALGVQGILLRSISLPPCKPGDLENVLRLQIENEFPVPPEALAWGSLPISGPDTSSSSSTESLQRLVIALKAEFLEDYASIFRELGWDSTFTSSAWARAVLAPASADTFTIADIQPKHIEWIAYEQHVPRSSYLLPLDPPNANAGSSQDWLAKALKALPAPFTTGPLFLTGDPRGVVQLEAQLASSNEVQRSPTRWPFDPTLGQSAAIEGLKTTLQKGGVSEIPRMVPGGTLAGIQDAPASPLTHQAPWLRIAALLFLGILGTRYAEPLLRKAELGRRIAAARATRASLPQITQELGFLQYYHSSQLPALDVLSVVSKSISPGMRMNGLSLTRRGELSFQGSGQNSDQVVGLRNELLKSQFFTTVVVEEQTPSPDRNKFEIKLSAQWNPDEPHSVPEEPEPNSSKPQPPHTP